MKILLDTDIGGDIDDALALAYLLKQPQCELLGVTTVGGEAEKRAALASALCHSVGRAEVPVHVGASAPLLVPERQPHAYQSEALTDRWPHRTFDKRNTAVEFLRDTIRAHPGAITLLTIGPLTNIGLLFALDPDIPALLKGMMVMGGSFSAKDNDEEWNILCDPHAAAIVFAAPWNSRQSGSTSPDSAAWRPMSAVAASRRRAGHWLLLRQWPKCFFVMKRRKSYSMIRWLPHSSSSLRCARLRRNASPSI